MTCKICFRHTTRFLPVGVPTQVTSCCASLVQYLNNIIDLISKLINVCIDSGCLVVVLVLTITPSGTQISEHSQIRLIHYSNYVDTKSVCKMG